MRRYHRLDDAYRFPRFRPASKVTGLFGDPRPACSGLKAGGKNGVRRLRDGALDVLRPHDSPVQDLSCGDTQKSLEFQVHRVWCRTCGKVKREQLDFLADNPLYTKRFAFYVGWRCRSAAID